MRLHREGPFAALVLVLLCAAPAAADDWKPMFNGKDLTGWEPVENKDAWKVEDGLLVCTGGGGGWLSTVDQYSNYEVELEFRLPPAGNSGLFIRTPREGNPAYVGMEIQILDDHDLSYATIQPWQHCGSIYGVVPPKTDVTKKAGEWQKMHVVADGRKVKVTLNETLIVDANLDEHKDKEAEHPGLKRDGGYIGLQNHGSRLEFKNIRMRKL